tara:strand:- start:135 stop:731 length:597 start_codon:yes stop_codon:yes gene_type:complete
LKGLKGNKKMLENALKYGALGWAILPCEPGTKRPVSALAPNGVHSASSDEATIRKWWTTRPDASIGLACGKPSGVVALDLDLRHGGPEFFAAAVDDNSPLPDNIYESHTGGGGIHYLFAYNNERSYHITPGVEIISNGHYIILPPSMHQSGKRYEWELSSSPIAEDYDTVSENAPVVVGDDSTGNESNFGPLRAIRAA